jgi:hypothetical protein
MLSSTVWDWPGMVVAWPKMPWDGLGCPGMPWDALACPSMPMAALMAHSRRTHACTPTRRCWGAESQTPLLAPAPMQSIMPPMPPPMPCSPLTLTTHHPPLPTHLSLHSLHSTRPRPSTRSPRTVRCCCCCYCRPRRRYLLLLFPSRRHRRLLAPSTPLAPIALH